MHNKEIKIFLADDHPIFREGLIKIIHQEKNFKVCDCCGNGNQAIEFIKKNKPDIAILDISMPGLSGIEISKIISNEKLPTKPIILTMYSEEEYLEEALENGVQGYLLKDSTAIEIIECIKTIISGGFFVSKELTDQLLRNKKTKSDKKEIELKLEKLTPTERQILKLVARNKTSNQIADEMFISYRTVQNHRINITNKLGLSGYNALLLFTIEHKDVICKM